MKNIILGAVILLCSITRVSAQTTSEVVGESIRNIHLELLGASNGIGIQYDSRFKGNTGWGYGIGAGWGFAYSSSNFFSYKEHAHNVSFSPRINYLLGRKNRKLELGFGMNIGYQYGSIEYDKYDWTIDDEGKLGVHYIGHVKESNNMMTYFFFGNIGYRRQAPRGFMFRIGLAPVFGFGGEHSINGIGFVPYLGFGMSF